MAIGSAITGGDCIGTGINAVTKKPTGKWKIVCRTFKSCWSRNEI